MLMQKILIFVKLFRLSYLPTVAGSCLIFMITFQKGLNNLGIIGLGFLTVTLITSGGFAFNDYFDSESDAIAHPERPIPSNQISNLRVIQISVLMFVAGLVIALATNPLAFGIAALASMFLILYSWLFKRILGFLSNIIIGILTGVTVPFFSEAVVHQTVSVLSLSFVLFIVFIDVGVNVLKDVVGLEGDIRRGYSTLPAKRGIPFSIKVAALLYLFAAMASPLPYIVGAVSAAYFIPMVLLDCIMCYSSLSLFRKTDVRTVKKQWKILTTSFFLVPAALLSGTFL